MGDLSEVLKKITVPRTNGDGPHPPSAEKPDDSDDQCKLCQGRGWVSPNAPVGSPEFGAIAPCQCQESRIENERYDRLLKYSNLGRLSRFKFENLERHGLSGSEDSKTLFLKAWETASSYAAAPKGWLTFVGPNGSGKTHLAVAIANHCIENDQVVFFSHAPDLLDHLRSSFGPASEISYSDLFEQVRTVPILILDGLGSHSATPWAEEKLRQILNHRYNAELPTVVTTATPLHEIDSYIAARLTAQGLGKIVELGERDMPQPTGLGAVPKLLSTKMTFATLKKEGLSGSEAGESHFFKAWEAARSYADAPKGWLTFVGPNGSGKTHLAAAIANHCVENDQVVFFSHAPGLLDHLRSSFGPASEISYSDLFEQVQTVPILILDGLGGHSATPWAEEKLRQILNHRYNAELPTVVTTASPLREIDPYIVARLTAQGLGKIVELGERDMQQTTGLGAMPKLLSEKMTFATLKKEGISGSETSKNHFFKAWEAARSYADDPKGWLTFVGPNGSGKTHLAAAIANHCVENDQVVFFSHAPDLLDHLRSSFGPASETSYSDLFEQVRTVPVLILDGLGSQSATPWAEEKLRQILNHRYNDKLSTVVTTAVPIHELDSYIAARLTAQGFGEVVELAERDMQQTTGLGAVPKLLSTKMTFADFETTLYDSQVESLKNALEKAKEYAQNPAIGERHWLTLAGNTGTGKTHLAVAIAVEQLKMDRPVFYISVPELLDYLRAAYSPESRVPYDRRFEKIKTSSLLILDGLGREQSSPWAMDKLRQIISYRHDEQLPTIVTTQLELNELDPVISSRIQDKDVVTLVKINARDYRAPDGGFISRADLRRRDWTPSMIDQLLGEADETAPNPHYPTAAPMQLYALTRVLEAESTDAFTEARKKKSARGR